MVKRVGTFFEGRSRLFKALVGLVAPTATIITTLLALGIISSHAQQDAIAKGLDATRDQSTSDLVLDVAVRSPAGGGQPIAFSAEGGFDHQAGRGRLFYDFSGTPGLESADNVEMVFARGVIYIRRPPLPGVPRKRPWLRADLAKVERVLADLRTAGGQAAADVDLGFLEGVDFTDPSRALDYLERSSDMKRVGEERLHAQPTTVYAGTLREDGQSYDLRAWIDDDDLIRQLRLRGGAERMTMTLGFRRFGVRVNTTSPPASRVTDLLELLGTG